MRLIDADAIDTKNYLMHDGKGNLVVDDTFTTGVIWMLQRIDETPTVEQKQGKWVWVYKTTDAYIQRTCSACGWSERMYHRNQDGLIRNYCPNCGARMDKHISGKEQDE